MRLLLPIQSMDAKNKKTKKKEKKVSPHFLAFYYKFVKCSALHLTSLAGGGLMGPETTILSWNMAPVVIFNYPTACLHYKTCPDPLWRSTQRLLSKLDGEALCNILIRLPSNKPPTVEEKTSVYSIELLWGLLARKMFRQHFCLDLDITRRGRPRW